MQGREEDFPFEVKLFRISIRSEYQQSGSSVFHGTLEIVAGQKLELRTLAELIGLLSKSGGWIDTPPCAEEVSKELVRTEREEVANLRRKSAISDPNTTKPNTIWKEKDDEKNA